MHFKGIDKRLLVLGDKTLDSLLDLLPRPATGNREAVEDGKPHAAQAHVAQAWAIGARVHFAHFLLVERLQSPTVLSEREDLFRIHLPIVYGAQVEAQLLPSLGVASETSQGKVVMMPACAFAC